MPSLASPLRTASVARAILYVVGVALILLETIAVGYRASSEWYDIQRRGEQRAAAALGLLEAVHEQAMLHTGTGEADPAIAVLDGAIERFSASAADMRIWLTMSPQLFAHQRRNAAQQTKSPDPELARDRIDEEAMANGKTATGMVDGWLRVSRPSVMGSGSASQSRCGSCHAHLKDGDVLGAYSVGVNLEEPKARWRGKVAFEAASASGIVLVVLGVIGALLSFTTLSPLRRLTAATRRLAAGDMAVDIDGTGRGDELGTLARSLEVFRGNLLEKLEAEERITHMAGHDAMTGLPNRANLHQFIDAAVAQCPGDAKIAVASIDLDEMKEINNERGHATGDELLITVARNLAAMLREGEFVARVGGDEFVGVKRFSAQPELFDFVLRLKGALRSDGDAFRDANPGAHIGVAIWPDDATTPDAVLAKADNALERARAEDLNCVCYYDAAVEASARRRRELMAALCGAAERGELFLNYQVQKSLKTMETTGHEALLRWRHRELGLISPVEFIPLAEQCRAIIGIGEWVLRTACRAAARRPQPRKIAVNLSPLQLSSPGLPELIHDVLMETGLPPQALELEITETAIITDKRDALRTLGRIKALGIAIALDDFGQGYSSLETLRSFPFDKIKLDRFFVTELVTSAEARAFIRAIITLGHSLSIPVLAEGIETADQLAVLRREDCDEGQGYLFGRPAPFMDLAAGARQAS